MKFHLAAALPLLLAAPSLPASDDSDARILHALNRLTWGPRPGDLERVRKIGLDAWIRRQLHPESLDDSKVERELARFENLALSIRDLLYKYPSPDANQPGSETVPKGLSPEQHGAYYARMEEMPRQLASAKLTRILGSERQLHEILVDFWFNHFNVAYEKDAVRWTLISFERDAIRPHALGRFRDLLGAVAKHPAMLAYLDNLRNHADPKTTRNLGPGTGSPRGPMGVDATLTLNENFARELLELHTLGVDGGYTQRDVREAARVLTGWGVQGLNADTAPQPVTFRFRPWVHDRGVKVVLGRTFGPDGGVEEGEALLDMLAAHPSTARRIARKLCVRFVSDDPPRALVERVAESFRNSGGDIRRTMETLVASEEFWNPAHYRAKVKTPLEYVASALRAAGVTARGFEPVLWALDGMGMPPYKCAPPTGYPQEAEHWLGASNLLARANFAWELFERPYGGHLRVPLPALLGEVPPEDGEAVADRLARVLLSRKPSEALREALRRKLEDPGVSQVKLAGGRTGVDARHLAALIVASPDFQRK